MDKLLCYGEQWGLSLDDAALEKFQLYQTELLRWNQSINLTRITAPGEVMVKHFLDSLTCLQVLPLAGGERVLDVGSGAGFPGIPLRIVRNIRLVLLDSSRKKIEFLQYLCRRLGFDDVEALHMRAEDLGHKEGYREAFDVVVARAVAPLDVLAELCLPFTAPGGFFLAQKGPRAKEEFQDAAGAITLLGGKAERMERVILPEGAGERYLVLIQKERGTPSQYPRKAGVPARRPLGKYT
ncbi:MAG: 16S rRNA (guanine(527)-N(7))-methyltransferase RsmG [bacterium]|jgi:16S rRNA (guanine527-N7)-methyltransferase